MKEEKEQKRINIYIQRVQYETEGLHRNHHCDILLTWNCKHLANYRKTQQIRRINAALGIHVPELLTPLELLNYESDV